MDWRLKAQPASLRAPVKNLPIDNPHFTNNRKRLFSLLAEKSFQKREVTLSSGKKSNFYIDCKQTALLAEGHFLIGQMCSQLIQQVAPRVEAVGGLTLGADPLASATATMSFLAGRKLNAFLIRKEAKGHGTDAYLEGTKNLRPNMSVAILEDVITTGASTLKAIQRAQSFGLKVEVVIALVDRCEGGRPEVEKHAPVFSLFTKDDFLN